jgi:hypothetical protein
MGINGGIYLRGDINLMKNISLNRFFWWFCVYFIRGCGLPFHLAPTKIPQNEFQKLQVAADANDVVIVFNAGGWGNTPLSKAADFSTILAGIQQTLTRSGYSATAIPYYRTHPGIAGRMSGTREQLNSFKKTSQKQIKDMQLLASNFPKKRFIIVGFSVGGGLSGKTLERLTALPNIYGITVGVPGWFRTFSSEKSLVLNNNNLDPLCAGDVKTIALYVFRGPFTWLSARLRGRRLSLALSLKFPHHEYLWDSTEVREPMVRFLQNHFKQVE